MKKMQVKIETEEKSNGLKYRLLTTHNGWQWSGGGNYSKTELLRVRDEINKFLGEDNE